MQFIQFQSQDPNSLNTPSAGNFNLFVDQADNNLKLKDSAGEVYGGNSGGGYSEVTYSGLVNTIMTSGLTAGSFYLITNFRTCYDQPDFDYNGNAITTGNYKQSAVQPIMVFATSVSTISSEAYQPAYPNDKIKYDWTYSATETTNNVAYGRITERIDEFDNRTDYDHRTILLKRYRLYTNREGLRLNGTIELLDDGTVEGNNTSFTALTVGDVVYIPNADPSYYEIVTIDDNVTMTVSGDTIATAGAGSAFYLAVEEDNDGSGYFSYKRTNVKTNDFVEYTTFGDAISNEYAKNNYVGNYANNYTNISGGEFLLANNVFLEGPYESNKFGDYCYNNTFGTDNSNNIWGDYCYQNVSTNDIDDNIIGHYFNNNLINTNLTSNHIGNNFNNNQLLAENNDDFEDNIIGNSFNNNIIYSRFYKNEILDNFNDNTIGDFGNLDNHVFYRNYIRNNFNQNIIRDDFQNNQIGTNFNNNTINGEFIGNTILNGFNYNQTGDYFAVNNIGNGFNNNNIYDNFYYNNTDYYFYNNIISYEFNENNVGTYFEDNKPSNYTLFGWNDTSTVSTRNYELFYDAVIGDLDGKVLGKELVMKIISTSQYFKIKFTQWTQSNSGGGFQYERQEIDSNGNPIGNLIIFNKTNGGSEVDVIVEGVVEITRGNSDGIYNIATEGSWNSNVSPQDTEWNSIYTETNNGQDFRNNKIGDSFNDNIIGNDFRDNQIGNYFNDNDIANDFRNNVIGMSFENNIINDGFGFGGSQYRGNKIGNYFYNNNIGEYFYDNTISDDFYNNTIGDYFQWNVVNTNINNTDFTPNYGNITGFTYTAIGTNATDNIYTLAGTTNGNGVGATFNVEVSSGAVIGVTGITEGIFYVTGNTITILGTDIGGYSNSIDTISDDGVGKNGSDGTYNDLSVTGGTGTNATFDVSVNSGLVDGVLINNRGNGYEINDELTLKGGLFGGTDGVDDITITVTAIFNDDVVITVTGISVNPSVYEQYTCQIFERQGGAKRLSFYDGNDTLTITNIDE